MKNKFGLIKLSLFVTAASLLFAGCNSIPFVPDKTIINKIFGAPSPVLEKQIKKFAGDGYQQIVAFSRSDESSFTSDDADFLTKNSPRGDSDAVVVDDKKFVVGTNTPYTEAQFEILRTRFVFKDYTAQYVNQSANANRNNLPKTSPNANSETKSANTELKNTNLEAKKEN